MSTQTRKHGLDTPFDFAGKSKKAAKKTRPCAHPACEMEGAFKTPKSPRELTEHIWLCAEHIREHNKAWNIFDGMTDDEVEAMVRHDTVWQRPTWKLGENRHAGGPRRRKGFADARFKDSFGLFDDDGDHAPHGAHHGGHGGQRTFAPGSPEAKAFQVLDLVPPVTLEDVKARYKQLVKRHHPDANNGDKAAEERFKAIAAAYALVVKLLEG